MAAVWSAAMNCQVRQNGPLTWSYCSNTGSPHGIQVLPLKRWANENGGRGGGRGQGREAGEETAGSGSSKRTRSGREIQNADSIYYRGRQEIKVREVGGSESLVSPHLI